MGTSFNTAEQSAIWLADANTIPDSHSRLSGYKLNLQTIFLNF